jgi:hypothetical protein
VGVIPPADVHVATDAGRKAKKMPEMSVCVIHSSGINQSSI